MYPTKTNRLLSKSTILAAHASSPVSTAMHTVSIGLRWRAPKEPPPCPTSRCKTHWEWTKNTVFERTGERKAEGERWNVWKLHAIATVKCETESTFLLMVDPPLFSLPNTTTGTSVYTIIQPSIKWHTSNPCKQITIKTSCTLRCQRVFEGLWCALGRSCLIMARASSLGSRETLETLPLLSN